MYLKNNIILIVVLISLEIIKELPITMILRPFNFETFVTTEDGAVIEKNIKSVIADINGMIKSESGLKGHLRAYDKLSERTFKPKGENKSYQKFSTRIKSKYAKVFDSGIPSNILYDRVTGKVHSANLKELVRTFTEAYKIAVKTLSLIHISEPTRPY